MSRSPIYEQVCAVKGNNPLHDRAAREAGNAAAQAIVDFVSDLLGASSSKQRDYALAR